MIYGYVSVRESETSNEEVEKQIDKLVAEGVSKENIFTDVRVIGSSKREAFAALLNVIQKGDTVYVEDLHRLGRNTLDLIELLQIFSHKQVILIFLKENLDFSSVSGKIINEFLKVLYTFEKKCMSENIKEGIDAARQKGHVGGRPKTSQKTIDRALTLYDEHNLTVSDICKVCSISRPTLYKAIKARDNEDEEISI